MIQLPERYACLATASFENGDYSIVPIRYQDRMEIMKWRNEQIYHLRQSKPLTEAGQEQYFIEVVSRLFEEKHPDQLLFSYLENGRCIGYGGLVHINWIDQTAEISFIMNTDLEETHFAFHWQTWLNMIEQVGFGALGLHKLFVYAFDLRQHLYTALEGADYFLDARLKEHCYFNGKHLDVIIHSKISPQP